MRKPVLLIFTNACILIVVFVLLAQSLFVVQRVALARQVSGLVEVQRGGAGDFKPLRAGQGIKNGDIVRTGPSGHAEFAWQNGTRWKLSPSSLLALEQAQFNPAKKREISRFRLESGQMLMRVVSSAASTSRFEIETPGALATARGTVFSVAVEKGATLVRVFQGRVEVSEPGGAQKSSISRGQKVRATALEFKTGADTDASEFLAAPTFLQPELRVKARLVAPGAAILSGQTEAGDQVTIDGKSVPVLGTGAFLKRVSIGANNQAWKVESTDPYGAKTVVWQRPPAPSCEAK